MKIIIDGEWLDDMIKVTSDLLDIARKNNVGQPITFGYEAQLSVYKLVKNSGTSARKDIEQAFKAGFDLGRRSGDDEVFMGRHLELKNYIEKHEF